MSRFLYLVCSIFFSLILNIFPFFNESSKVPLLFKIFALLAKIKFSCFFFFFYMITFSKLFFLSDLFIKTNQFSNF